MIATEPPAAKVRRHFDPAYWAGIRYMAFGRAVPGMLFGFMGWLQLSKVLANAQHLPAHASAGRVAANIVSPSLYTVFCAIPAGLYLTRSAPRSRDGRTVARSAAFGGTLMQLVVGAFLGTGPLLFTVPPLVGAVSVLLSIVAFSGAIWSLAYLRRNLSIIPEARRLSTGGPYRLVRHPLYFFEILAAVSVLAAAPGAISAASFVVFVAIQLTRARFEERLLTATIPEYAAYARRTSRIIPGVW